MKRPSEGVLPVLPFTPLPRSVTSEGPRDDGQGEEEKEREVEMTYEKRLVKTKGKEDRE